MVRTTLVASLLAAAASTLAVGPNAKVAGYTVPRAYIFELQDDHDASVFEQTVAPHGTTRMKLQYSLLNAVSVQLHDVDTADASLAKLSARPEVKAVHPVIMYDGPDAKLQSVASKDGLPLQAGAAGLPDTYSTHVMTQVDKLRAKNITGKGTKVAVVDTGIDYTHPALGGCFGEGCLVGFGYDFAGDGFAPWKAPQPGGKPLDCAGHGTHVAGIIAAQSNNPYGFTGAAPGVTLGAYRVFGCNATAGTSNELVIAAFNKAYEDGAHIISASLGGAGGWSDEAWSATISRIADKGVICVVAAGNDGAQGVFYTDSPDSGRHVIAVASFDNVLTPSLMDVAKYQVDNGPQEKFAHVPAEGVKWEDVTLPVWASSLNTTVANDGCNPLPANTPDLSKHIVLIRRGGCLFIDKMKNAISKGAKYIVFYDNTSKGPIQIGFSNGPPAGLGAVSMIDDKTGAMFIKALQERKTLTLSMLKTSDIQRVLQSWNNTVTGGGLSDYTSWGPTFNMENKPQFGAVGGNVLSTYPLSLGGYAVESGTSMACPQAAAIMALIRQVRGNLDGSTMQSLLAANANPQLFNDGNQFYNFLAPVMQQGGGLVQAYDAAYATTLLTPTGLSFNDTDHHAKSLTFTLRNTDRKPATYKITHVPSVAMYALGKGSIYVQPFPNEIVPAAATLAFSETSITLRGGQSRTISVSATPPRNVDAKRLALWSGYIAINGTDGASLSLPYQGLTGSLHGATVLASNDTWIASSTDKNATPLPNNTTFAIPAPGNAVYNDTLPQITMNLAMGASLLSIYIVPLNPNNETVTTETWGVKTIGQPFGYPTPFSPRGASVAAWDGRLASGSYAAPGTYKFVVRALRIFGDEKKREDWDESTTPAVTIRYL